MRHFSPNGNCNCGTIWFWCQEAREPLNTGISALDTMQSPKLLASGSLKIIERLVTELHHKSPSLTSKIYMLSYLLIVHVYSYIIQAFLAFNLPDLTLRFFQRTNRNLRFRTRIRYLKTESTQINLLKNSVLTIWISMLSLRLETTSNVGEAQHPRHSGLLRKWRWQCSSGRHVQRVRPWARRLQIKRDAQYSTAVQTRVQHHTERPVQKDVLENVRHLCSASLNFKHN